MTSTNFVVQAGEPFPRELDADYQRIRVSFPTDRSYWLEPEDFEVLMQMRAGKSETTELRADLSEFLTVSMDGLDILIDWAMTGADTRALDDAGGYYDLIVSDPGTVDADAKIVLSGRLTVLPVITAATAAP